MSYQFTSCHSIPQESLAEMKGKHHPCCRQQNLKEPEKFVKKYRNQVALFSDYSFLFYYYYFLFAGRM